MSENKKPKKDTQSRSWSLCLHNIEKTGYNHEKIVSVLSSIPSMIYYCLADEIGQKTQRLHTHIFFHTRSPLRFHTVKNKFEGADLRIEESYGNAQQNRDYVFKSGKWEDDPKADQKIPESQEEWGKLPVSKQGHRTDLEEVYTLVKEGYTDAQILDACGEPAIKHIDKLGKLRHAYLIDKFKGQRRLDLKVHYIFGLTGTGKTRDILDKHGDENVYRVTDYTHPFDSYQLQPVLVFEEFRSSLRIQDMLNYLDIYPLELPARYHQKVACFTVVYVVSNWTFEQQYSGIQEDPEQIATYQAWVRRFNGFVKCYTDTSIEEYPSMASYLAQSDGFRPALGPVPFD